MASFSITAVAPGREGNSDYILILRHRCHCFRLFNSLETAFDRPIKTINTPLSRNDNSSDGKHRFLVISFNGKLESRSKAALFDFAYTVWIPEAKRIGKIFH